MRWPERLVKLRLVRTLLVLQPVVLIRDKCKASTLASLRFNHRPRLVRTLPEHSRPELDMHRPRLERLPPVRSRQERSRPVLDTHRLRPARTLPTQSPLARSPPVPDTHRLLPVRTPPTQSPLERSRPVVSDLLERPEQTWQALGASMGLARWPVLAIPVAQEAQALREVVNSRRALLKTLS